MSRWSNAKLQILIYNMLYNIQLITLYLKSQHKYKLNIQYLTKSMYHANCWVNATF